MYLKYFIASEAIESNQPDGKLHDLIDVAEGDQSEVNHHQPSGRFLAWQELTRA
jgi:hypothetical protein